MGALTICFPLVVRDEVTYKGFMKRFVILAGVIVLAIVAWSGAWLYFSRQISNEIAAMANPVDPSLPALQCDKFSVGGFPFQFAGRCVGVTLQSGDKTVTLEQIEAIALVYRPTHIVAFMEGPLKYSDAFFGTEQEARWSKLKASLRLDKGQLIRASLTGTDMQYFDLLIGETLIAGTENIEAHILDVPEKANPEQFRATLALFLSTNGTEAPGLSLAGGRATLEAEISQLPQDVGLWAHPEIARLWQVGGGELTLSRFEGDTADTNFLVSGSVNLDGNGQVNGKFAIETTGLVEQFSYLLTPELRPLILGAPREDGSYAQNITARQGTIYSGLVPIGQLPPLF